MTSSVIKNCCDERIDLTFHSGSRRDSLVIIGHGVTANKDRPQLVALAEGLSARGWPCMRISFAGNGESEGRFEDCTISKEIDDLRSVLETVPDWVRIAYIGHSMGSAVGVLTAARDLRIRLLVSLAGMTHTAAFYDREFGTLTPGNDCMWDEVDHPLSEAFADDMKSIGSVLPAAATIVQPWLLIHGNEDDLVPLQDGLDAFAAAPGAKKWLEIPGAGHSFDEGSYPTLVSAVHEWLTHHFGKE
jgi:pimeloyl-ACP methyl ester carboxylesterase